VARVRHRLAADAVYPAGVASVTTRQVSLRSGIRVRVLESGPADGTPVVLMHGWGACAYMHRYALGDLAAAGFRALAPDLRGHGESEKPVGRGQYATERLLDDLASLIEALSLRRPALLGQSMGGGLALRYALEHPNDVSALVLVSPAGLCTIPAARVGRRFSPPVLDRMARFLVPRIAVTAALRATYGDPRRITRRDVDEYWAQSRDPNYARAMRALLHEFDLEPMSDSRLRELTVPTLLFVGTMDRLLRNAPVGARRLPQARLVVTEGGGHVLNEELHDRVNEEIVRFLRAGAATQS
jgi:pimeloyl-ACP methyl ester carboxylesterase